MAVSAGRRVVFDKGVLREEVVAPAPSEVGRRFSVDLVLLGFFTLLISAWGGIAVFVGPLFGFSADGGGAWQWSMAHFLLAFLPGLVGCLAGLMLMAEAPGTAVGSGRGGISFSGIIAVLAGAWFVIGPLSWPIIESGHYFVRAGSLANLANQVGFALGPGLLLAAFGGMAIGWAIRHRPVTVATSSMLAPSPAAVTVVGEAPSAPVWVMQPTQAEGPPPETPVSSTGPATS